ncbi:MAG: NAD(P)-dependent alcohol dehydrogenase [Actinobacteria bacterium]|nr:NAD(P)-dependent alcohol dehydrogenase [Actinomycetota bacterium]
MKAVQLVAWHSDPALVEVDVPTAGPGQVVLKVAGAGLCHSDLHLLHDFGDGMFPWGPPFTLGHENSGWVHQVGAGVEGLSIGQPVAVFGPWGCGHCQACDRGQDTYCHAPTDSYGSAFGGGLGVDGGQAEFMLVPDARFLVPIPDALDPVAAAPLTDAGLTPYHAVKMSLPKLMPGSTALCIGVGGLGHMGVQFIRALTGANIIAMDLKDEALALATACGADLTIRSDAEDAVAQVKDATGGRGADVVIDFVGIDSTLAMAAASAKVQGDMTIVGVGGGSFPMSLFSPPYECNVRSIYWGTRSELGEVLALAAKGLITPEYSTYSLDQALEAYAAMEAGKLKGRAVIVP